MAAPSLNPLDQPSPWGACRCPMGAGKHSDTPPDCALSNCLVPGCEVRIRGKASWLLVPALIDVFRRGKPSKSFEALGAIVGHQAGVEVLFQVLRRLGRAFFDGGFFEGAVHALDWAIRPGLIGFGEAVLKAGLLTHTRQDLLEGIVIPLASGALPAVVRQDRRDCIGHSVNEVTQEVRRDGLDGLRGQRGVGKRASAVDGDQQVELAFCGPYVGTRDVEVADRLRLECFLRRLVAFQIWQAAEAMPLKAPMPGRSGQVRPRGLHGIQAVIQWQQRRLAAGDHERCFLPG
jgi:hypothetical protein